jgi:hypothetical protein
MAANSPVKPRAIETVQPESSVGGASGDVVADERKPSDSSDAAAMDFRLLRRSVVCAWGTCFLAMALAWGQDRLAVLHPWSFTFIALLAATFAMSLWSCLLPRFWRLLRGSSGVRALAWIGMGMVPAGLWVALGWHGSHQWSQRRVPGGFSGILVRMSGASLADAHARWVYPHRMEGQRLIMFFDETLSDPQGDLRQMDEHLSRLEKLTQLRMREKVHWIRGAFHEHRFAMYGLAFGSSRSPVGETDCHELAHAFLNQHTGPGPGSPMLLVEGWAEAQSQDSRSLARHVLAHRQFISTWTPEWRTMSLPEQEKFLQQYPDPEGTKTLLDTPPRSYLRELTNPFWSTHDAGAVYWFGGAFVDFFIRRYGISRFLELYFHAASRGFEAECRRSCGVDLTALESEFRQDVEHRSRRAVN